MVGYDQMTLDNVNIHFIDEPFYIQDSFPLENNVYVLDNYLETSLWKTIDNELHRRTAWSKNNQVNGDIPNRGGLPNHQLWGCSYFSGVDFKEGYDNPNKPLMRWFDRKIRTDFGFDWVRFQYMGGNSQTHGQHGTCHSDASQQDEWSLSFLYYTNSFWNPNFGGRLRFYKDTIPMGILEDMNHLEIGSVDFVPNRLLMFDGRIPHGAEAPHKNAKYLDRRSIVLRGDEIEVLDEKRRYAHD